MLDSTYAVGAMPAYMSAVKNLKDTDYMENKRAQKSLAVAKVDGSVVCLLELLLRRGSIEIRFAIGPLWN